ncbi:hypothetical protein KKF84_08150 [Myxococcota bacterium]|nr:hypothetical protein [Myxococcota bacterium]MBU1535279.1 hypothetical protein [Myxococcota bacterium]
MILSTRSLVILVLFSLGTFMGCSKPPIFRITIPAKHVASVEQRLLVRALEYKNEWQDAKKAYALENARTRLRKMDYLQAVAWLRAADLQLKRAAYAKTLKKDVLDADETKTPKEAENEYKLAKLHLQYRELLNDYHQLFLDLYTWKGRSFRAQYMEEVVGALHKTQSSLAGSYSRVAFADQTYKIRRKYLVLEEKFDIVTKKLNALRKRIGELWAPNFRKQPPPPPASCKPCSPCPVAQPCPKADAAADDKDTGDKDGDKDTGDQTPEPDKTPEKGTPDTTKPTTKTTTKTPAPVPAKETPKPTK